MPKGVFLMSDNIVISIENCKKLFPFLTESNLRSILKNLADKGLVAIESREETAEPIEEKEDISLEQKRKDFAIIYGIYPKKVGKAGAFDKYCKWISKNGMRINGKTYHLTNKEIYLAVKRYVTDLQSKDTDLQFYKNFDVLMGKSLIDYLPEESEE